MSEIDTLRAQIDAVDEKLLALFEERMRIAREVGRYKAERGLPVFVPEREAQLVADRLARLTDETLAPAAESFFRALMSASRDEQRKIAQSLAPIGAQKGLRVAYQGIEGAYGEQAARGCFGAGAELLSCARFEDVFIAVSSGRAALGVVPIENSTGGSINEVYDLLGSYGCYIAGEYVLQVEHLLLANEGAAIGDIREVYSHEQGFRQCSRYLSDKDWNCVPYRNTAVSAQFVAQSGRTDIAAIASARAAEVYGLHVLACDIADQDDNFTRFIVVSGELREQAGRGKISIAFTVRHESGSLHAVLSHFARRSLNLTKIESRNIPGKSWEYRFYIDFEGEIDRVHIERVLEELKPLTVERQLLGYYASANGAKP